MLYHPSLKIIVGYHKPAYLLKSNLMIPVMAGADAISQTTKDGKVSAEDVKWFDEHCFKDNDGENISSKNRYYSELSVLYWAWKNYDKIGNPDYIGFMQYRRHFLLNEDLVQKMQWTDYEKGYSAKWLYYPPKNYIDLMQFNEDKFQEILKDNTGIIVKSIDFRCYNNTQSVREDYEKNIVGGNVKDFDLLIKYVQEHYPQYAKYAEAQNTRATAHLYQMFVLPKKVFFEYMEFMFPILFELEKHIDVSDYPVNGKRTMGYLGEKLYDIFFEYRKNELGEQYAELPVDLLDNTQPEEKVFIRLCGVKICMYKFLYFLPLPKKIKNKFKDKFKFLRSQKRLMACAKENILVDYQGKSWIGDL